MTIVQHAGRVLAAASLAAGLSASASEAPRTLGFYLHACWDFAHPYAVRSWSPVGVISSISA